MCGGSVSLALKAKMCRRSKPAVGIGGDSPAVVALQLFRRARAREPAPRGEEEIAVRKKDTATSGDGAPRRRTFCPFAWLAAVRGERPITKFPDAAPPAQSSRRRSHARRDQRSAQFRRARLPSLLPVNSPMTCHDVLCILKSYGEFPSEFDLVLAYQRPACAPPSTCRISPVTCFACAR